MNRFGFSGFEVLLIVAAFSLGAITFAQRQEPLDEECAAEARVVTHKGTRGFDWAEYRSCVKAKTSPEDAVTS